MCLNLLNDQIAVSAMVQLVELSNLVQFLKHWLTIDNAITLSKLNKIGWFVQFAQETGFS